MKKRHVLLSAFTVALGASCADSDASGETTVGKIPNAALVVANGSGNLAIIDPQSAKVVSTLAVAAGLHPHHIGVSPDGAQLLVSAPSTDLSLGHSRAGHADHGGGGAHSVIYRLDIATGELQNIIEVEATAHNAAFAPDGSAIVFGMMEHGMVSVFDAATLEERFSVTGFEMPLEVTPAGGQLVLVAESGAARIAELDLTMRTVVNRFDVGAVPVAAWATDDANFFVSSEESTAMRHLTEGTGGLALDEHVIDAGGIPGQAVRVPNKSELWVAIEDKGLVAILDASTHARMHEVAVGVKPHAIAFDPTGSKAFVTDEESGKLFVIDATTHAVASEIELGGKPNAVVWIERR
jgi:YVTN family beta-propeller protein